MKKERKMIVAEVSFWTNGIRAPRHAWAGGVVKVRPSKLHKIGSSAKPRTFNSLLDLGRAIEKAILDADVQLHLSRSMKRYMRKGRAA